MTVRVDDLAPCSACGGKLFPLVLCEKCGAATIIRDARQLDRAAGCAECGAFNPWQLICDQCHSRFPMPGAPSEPSPERAPAEPPPPTATAPQGRPKRRVKGELDTRALLDMLKTLGLDPSRAQALIDRGYDGLWKIARASAEELARIPEVGPVAARKVLASFHLLKYSPPQRTQEQIARDEYVCPLCACVTSAFAPVCLECGAVFDEEEMDEAIRRQFADEGDAGLLAFYDGRLAEKADDPDLLYARGLLLESMGRVDEAIATLDRASAKAPDARKIKVAQLRIQAKGSRTPSVAEKLRSTASSLLDDVAWDQEVAELDQLITEAEPACPDCGATVPKDAAECPSCGSRLPGAPAETAPTPPKAEPAPELDTLVDDLLVGELEESLTPQELELTKAAVLDWLIEELEESMGTGEPIAPTPQKPGDTETPTEASPLSTSVGFLSSWMRGSRGLVSGSRPKSAPRGAGKVNGLVNGRGRVNGLVNGLVNGVGRTNGLVNGRGRVNGLVQPAGRVNGLMGGLGPTDTTAGATRFVSSGAKRLRVSAPSRRVRYAAIASGALVAVVIASFLFIPPPGPWTPIVIDGSFGDWASVPKFDAATIASDTNVSIRQYADFLDAPRSTLYLFASTGDTFGEAVGYDGMYFLIDADGNASTGLTFDGIGADAVVDVFGADHTVGGARLYAFPANAEVNWSERQSRGPVRAAASRDGLEVGVSTYDIDRFNATAFRISVFADDFRGMSSRSKAFLSSAGGAVLLQVQPLTLVLGTGPTPLFEIHAHALGIGVADAWRVSNFTTNATPGVVVSLSAESVNLTQGRPDATITASVSAPGFFPGDAVRVDLVGANSSSLGPVVVRADPVRAYVIAAPSTVRIDGLFTDWTSRDVADTDPRPVNDSALDIVRSGAATSNATAFFHVQVAGSLLSGGLPERIVRLPPSSGNGSSGGGAIVPRQTGEDVLLVYVDANASDSRGLPIGGILADYLIEIRGQGGQISSKTLYSWSNRWVRQTGVSIDAEKDSTDIEASLPLPSLNGTRMVFESTDWSSAADSTVAIGAPSFVPASQFAVGARGLDGPEGSGFGGSTFYLRDVGPSIPPGIDCTAVKGLSTTQGNSVLSLTLSRGSKPCFLTDTATSPEIIYAGMWFASLDLSTSSGTVLNITFAITGQDGASPTLICWSNTTTNGGADQVFSCSGGDVSIATDQRIRLRVEFVSGASANLGYDGSGTSQVRSMTVLAPEFGDVVAPSIATGILILFVSYRRRRRARQPPVGLSGLAIFDVARFTRPSR